MFLGFSKIEAKKQDPTWQESLNKKNNRQRELTSPKICNEEPQDQNCSAKQQEGARKRVRKHALETCGVDEKMDQHIYA
jgi:hypothetical protein